MIRDIQLRDMLVTNIHNGTFEEVVRKMRFSNNRFAVLPVSYVAREINACTPKNFQTGTFVSCSQDRIFEIMKSVIQFRKVLDAVEVCPRSLQHLSAAVHEDLETPFTGFIVEKDGSGTFVRASLRETIAMYNRKSARLEKHARKRRRTERSCKTLLEQHRRRVDEIEAELKDTNKAYARIVEENDALSDEVDIANTKILGLAREKDRKWTSMQQQLQSHETTIAMMEFELAEISKRAPETQAMLVNITRERDRARSEVVNFKSQLEAYDNYLELKLKEFKDTTKTMICSHRIPAETKQNVIEIIRDDVLIGRNHAWRKEKAGLLACIKDKEETETAIEAEGMMCLCQRNVKRCKLECGHSLCRQCITKVEICPYCRATCKVSQVFEP